MAKTVQQLIDLLSNEDPNAPVVAHIDQQHCSPMYNMSVERGEVRPEDREEDEPVHYVVLDLYDHDYAPFEVKR